MDVDRPLSDEMFAAVLNIAELSEERLTQAIVAMLQNGQNELGKISRRE